MADSRAGDRHKHPGITWRPSGQIAEQLADYCDKHAITPGTVIGIAVAELLHAAAAAEQLADVAAFNRSAELIDRVNGSAGLFAESR